jgi:hypothetical protein
LVFRHRKSPCLLATYRLSKLLERRRSREGFRQPDPGFDGGGDFFETVNQGDPDAVCTPKQMDEGLLYMFIDPARFRAWRWPSLCSNSASEIAKR